MSIEVTVQDQDKVSQNKRLLSFLQVVSATGVLIKQRLLSLWIVSAVGVLVKENVLVVIGALFLRTLFHVSPHFSSVEHPGPAKYCLFESMYALTTLQ